MDLTLETENASLTFRDVRATRQEMRHTLPGGAQIEEWEIILPALPLALQEPQRGLECRGRLAEPDDRDVPFRAWRVGCILRTYQDGELVTKLYCQVRHPPPGGEPPTTRT